MICRFKTALATLACFFSVSLFAQGNLEPLTTPGPTMKTLDQVEARTPVFEAGSLTEPGSYYLTKNIVGRITIGADNISLDLNGFVLDATGTGGIWAPGVKNIEVFNGRIINGNISSQNIYGAIAANGGGAFSVRDIAISGTANCGTFTNPTGTIEYLRVQCAETTSFGFRASASVANPVRVIIRDSTFRETTLNAILVGTTNGDSGLKAVDISHNRLYDNANAIFVTDGGGASSGVISDNHVYGNSGVGIDVTGDFIVARNLAQANTTNYDLAAAPNAAAVSSLAASTSAWDNISE